MAEPSSLTRPGLSQFVLYIFTRLGDKAIILVAAITWHGARESSRATKTSTETPSNTCSLYILWIAIPHLRSTLENMQPCRVSYQKQPSLAANKGQLWARFRLQGLSCSTITGDSSRGS